MIQKLTISPNQISDYTCVTINSQGPLSSFPFLSVDRDSYLVGVEVQSSINFDPAGGRHCIAIGKGWSDPSQRLCCCSGRCRHKGCATLCHCGGKSRQNPPLPV